jgi:hypothetical protein
MFGKKKKTEKTLKAKDLKRLDSMEYNPNKDKALVPLVYGSELVVLGAGLAFTGAGVSLSNPPAGVSLANTGAGIAVGGAGCITGAEILDEATYRREQKKENAKRSDNYNNDNKLLQKLNKKSKSKSSQLTI